MQNSGFNVLLEPGNLWRLLQGLSVTLSIALTSLGLSILAGTLLGIVMTSRSRIIRFITGAYLAFIRVMPQLVLLFVVFFALARETGLDIDGKLAAIIVFTLWGTAEMGDLTRGAITSIPRHQRTSAEALGLSTTQVLRFVVLPQALRRMVPPIVNLATRMVMTTSLVVLIGVVEVLKTGQQIIDAHRFDYPDAALWVYGAIFAMYFFACWPLSVVSRRLEKAWANS